MSAQSNNGSSTATSRISPSFNKSGPLKATIPLSSFIKHKENIKSPSKSPVTFKIISPDYQLTGQRSPGASVFKVRTKYGNENSPLEASMRRTVSLDTLYLKGQWPRDSYVWSAGSLQLDKSTQTEEEFDWTDTKNITLPLAEINEKLLIKARNNKEIYFKDINNSSSQTQTVKVIPPIKVNQILIPIKPISRISMRSSVEGLNQEIEKLILRTSSENEEEKKEEFNRFSQITPEGHRAPLAEIFRAGRSRSVNTQTPSDCEPFGSSCHLSGDSQGSSPDQENTKLSSSPRINRFLAREPPDGCERICSKILNENSSFKMEGTPSQPSSFKLKPSLGSAFQILNPNKSSDKDLPTVP